MTKAAIFMLVAAAILIGVVSYITAKIRKFNREMFGTSKIPVSDAVKGLKQGLDESRIHPKSVSAQTSLLLPLIRRDFPEFHYDEVKQQGSNLILRYMQAVQQQSPVLLADCNVTDDVTLALRNQLEKNKASGVTECYTEPKIHRLEISRYDKRDGMCKIVFQAAVQSMHYFRSEQGTKGSMTDYEQSRFEVDLVYIQNRDLIQQDMDEGQALNCPNCGAPIKKLGAKSCEYCGAAIVEYNIKVWQFNRCVQI